MPWRFLIVLLFAAITCAATSVAFADHPLPADFAPKDVVEFLQSNCFDCHEGQGSEAGLDLSVLPTEFSKTDIQKWSRIFDRVKDGEMPPPNDAELDRDERDAFLESTKQWLNSEQRYEFGEKGRVRGRRLTNVQLERTLHDLLGIDTPLASLMTDEPKVNGFTTVANGQPMSHFQLEQHVAVVDAALDEAFKRGFDQEDRGNWTKMLEARKVARNNPRRRTREPEMLNGFAVTWSAKLVFYGRIPATEAKESGWYRIKVRSKALNPDPEGVVWCTVRTGECVSSAPLMAWAGAFEAKPEVDEYTVETWLPAGHQFEIRPGDALHKKGRFRGGQIGTGEGEPQRLPGVAIESIELTRFHRGHTDAEIRETLFGGLEITGERSEATLAMPAKPRLELAKLMKQFAQRAFRRPVSEETLEPFLKIANQTIGRGEPFDVALKAGYRSMLCSPRFMYFFELPGKLDDYALASRLSYFLWNRMPDQRLRQLASEGKLRDPKVLRNQVERMLRDENANEFVNDFAAEWLDLSLIDFTEPDPKLYPGFDQIVQNSMLEETQTFLKTMLEKDLSVSNLIDSDFTFLNSRLAKFYDISGVRGDEMRNVKVTQRSHRGGLVTQGAILKVTANGTTTSPVIRGVWVSERLLGEEIPPPPANVSAIEPDIRGAKTIREQLEKHKNDPSCASCHVKMDPPGFALENFDPSGRWRSNYLKLSGRRRVAGAPVDASSELVDGGPFQNLKQFQTLIVEDEPRLATNLTEKLLTYGTGAGVAFSDREAIEQAVASASESNYGFRSILHAVIQSEIFRTK
ncbi:MAG: hypothetical protein ACI87E_003250 [Mariniblastus sp.]|jgi:hypothetical protein